jgi:hypothetical protein
LPQENAIIASSLSASDKAALTFSRRVRGVSIHLLSLWERIEVRYKLVR